MKIKIEAEKCIACGACVNACPPGLITISEDKAIVTGEPGDCVACKACETVCPAGAIKVTQ